MKSLLLIAFIGLILACSLSWAMPRLFAKPERFPLGLRLLDQGKPEQAVHLFQQPQWQGVAQYRAQRFRRAIASFVQGEDVTSLYNLGNAYARLHEWAGAKAAYRQALRLNPEHEDTLFNLELVIRAESLEQQLLENSRQMKERGEWKDGEFEQSAQDSEVGDNIEEGESEGGAFRPASEDAEVTSESAIEGRSGDQAEFLDPQAGLASGASDEQNSDGELTGSGASLLLPRSQHDVEILLRRISDQPERVLRARLAAAYKKRSGAALSQMPELER